MSTGMGRWRVAADADPVAVFAVVQVLVLVAQDGQAGAVGQFVAALQLRQRRGLDVLVGQRQQRHLHADHACRARGPRTRRRRPRCPPGSPGGRFDAGDLAVGLLDAGDGGGAEVGHAGLAGALDQQLNGAGGRGQAVGRDVQAAEDLVPSRVPVFSSG